MPHVFDIYYELLMKQLTGGKRKTVDLSPAKMQAALAAVERKIVADGPSNPNNMNASFESFRKRQENPDDYLQIKPDSDTINGMSRYEYSKACRKELMKSVERSVRQALEWRNAAIRLGLTERNGNAKSIDTHRWMDKLMKTDGSPESLEYNESIVALAALGNKQMTEQQYADWRVTYYLRKKDPVNWKNLGAAEESNAFAAAAKDRNSAGDFIYGEVRKIVDHTPLDNYKIAVNAIASGDFSNEIFAGIDENKRLEKAFEILRHDAVLLGSEAVMMFQILNRIGGFNLSQAEQAKVNTDWVSKIYPYVGVGNVANLAANPYFAIIDPYKHYRSTMPTPEVPVNEMKKREKDVLAYSVMGEKTIYEARTAEIYENILKKYEVNLYSEVDRLQGISVHNKENTDKVVILEFTPTTANEMVDVKVCDRPGRLVSTDMSERVQGLLGRCAGWSRESHTSNEFENMRGALEALRNITLIDNPSTENIKAANTAFTHLKNMTDAYLIRKRTYHNGTKYEKARIKFAKDVMAFANKKLAQLDYCDKHIKTVSARQQQAENNQPPQGENINENVHQPVDNNIFNGNDPQVENNQPPQGENINENVHQPVDNNIFNGNDPKAENNQPPQGENINGNDPQVEIDGEKLYNELMKKCSIEQIQAWLDKFHNYKELDEKSKEKFISLGNNYINCLKGVHNSLTENNFQALYTAEQDFYDAFTGYDEYMRVMFQDFGAEVDLFNAHDTFMRKLAKPNAFKEAALAARLNPEKKPEVKAEPIVNDPKNEVKAEPIVDAQKNEAEQNVNAPKDEAEPIVGAPKNEAEPIVNAPKDEAKPNVDAPKNEAEPIVGAPKNEAEPIVNAPKDEIKAEPVDAQKNENDNEPLKQEENNEPLKQEENIEPPKQEENNEQPKQEENNEPPKQEENNEQPKDEVKAEPVDAQKNENDNEPNNGKPDYVDAWSDAEVYARDQVREFMAKKKAYDALEFPDNRESMAYDLSDLTRKALAGYVIRELISSEDPISSEEDEPNTEPLVTQLVNMGKMNVLVDKIIKSEPFNSQLKQVLTNFGTAKTFFENIPSNLKGSLKDNGKRASKIMERKMCLEAGTQFLAKFKKELELEKQKKPEVKKEQSVNAQKNDNKEREEENKNATNGAQAAAEKYAKGNIGVFTTMKRGYDRLKIPAMRESMVKGMLDYAQKGIAGYIILELISKSKEPNADVKSTITQLTNGGKLDELSDEIIKSEQFDNYFGKVIKDFNACKEFLSRLQDNPSSDARKCCFMAGMDFVEEFKKGPQKKETENNAKEQIVNTASEKNGKESQMQGKVK